MHEKKKKPPEFLFMVHAIAGKFEHYVVFLLFSSWDHFLRLRTLSGPSLCVRRGKNESKQRWK